MKTATTNAKEMYIYVKDGVIFKVLLNDNGDRCAVKVDSANTPSFKVTPKGSTETINYYLSDLIEAGDKYSSGTFIKTIHKSDDSEDESSTYANYYYNECLKVVKKKILDNFNVEYGDLNMNNLGVPSYMIKQNGDTVTGMTQIDLSETNFNNWLKEGVAELALKSAKATANAYNFNVTTETIEVEKKQD